VRIDWRVVAVMPRAVGTVVVAVAAVVADIVRDVVPRRVPADAAVVGAAERHRAVRSRRPARQPGNLGRVHDDVVVRRLEGVARVRAGVRAHRAPRGRRALGIGERRALELELLQGAALARQVLRVALGFLGCREGRRGKTRVMRGVLGQTSVGTRRNGSRA
jgi:hypothetical protein